MAGLSLSQLASCRSYTGSGVLEELPAFLEAAREADALSGADLEVLHPLYGHLMRRQWTDLLPMRALFGTPPLSAWVEFFVTYSQRGGRSATLRYLHDHYGVRDLAKVPLPTQLGRLDSFLVAYQRHHRGRRSLRRLTDWYYERGWGAHTISLTPSYLDFEHRVLDEVARRNNYYAVAGILRTFHGIIAMECAVRGVGFSALADLVGPWLSAGAVTYRLQRAPFERETLHSPFYAYSRRDELAAVDVLYVQTMDRTEDRPSDAPLDPRYRIGSGENRVTDSA